MKARTISDVRFIDRIGEAKRAVADALSWIGGEANSASQMQIAQAFTDALNQGTEFLTMHLRDPRQMQSRCVLVCLGPAGLDRTKAAIKQFTGCNQTELTNEKATEFHGRLLETYFHLIGRADAVSDVVLRAVTRTKGTERIRRYRLIYSSDSKIPIYTRNVQGRHPFEIRVARSIESTLLGRVVTDQDFDTAKCHLLELLYTTVWRTLHEKETSDADRLRHAREYLRHQCFFTTREALVAGEAARILRDDARHDKTLAASAQLFSSKSRNGGKNYLANLAHSTKIAMTEQLLSMIQSVAIYVPIGGLEYTVVARNPSNYGDLFASGVTIGGSCDEGLFSACKELLDEVVHRFGIVRPPDPRPRSLSEDVEWINTLTPKLKQYQEYGLHTIAIQSFAYCAAGLLGRTHEGEKLSFRLALGSEESLREVFSPVYGELGLAEPGETDFYTIALPSSLSDNATKRRLLNELDRWIALIEANYSFLQDKEHFLCIVSSRQGNELRYVAELNPRVRRSYAQAGRSIARIEDLDALSAAAPSVMLALLDSDDTGYIACGGATLAIGKKLGGWSRSKEPNWLHDKLVKVQEWWKRREDEQMIGADEQMIGVNAHLESLRKSSDTITDILFQTIQLISDAPGKGATFVLGKCSEQFQRNSKDGETQLAGNPFVKMTPVFAVRQGWKLSEMTKAMLYQVAIQDGATVLATEADIPRVHCRIHLSSYDTEQNQPFDPETWCPVKGDPKTLLEHWKGDGLYSWKEWGRWFKWGTRHKTAAGLAYVGRGKFTVICISSDGDVHIFDGYRVLDVSKRSPKSPGSSSIPRHS